MLIQVSRCVTIVAIGLSTVFGMLSCNDARDSRQQDVSREASAKHLGAERAKDEKVTNIPVAPPSTYYLDDAEIDVLKARASRGDATAAYRIAIHYENSSDPMPKDTMDWLYQAAELGHVGAMQRLGFFLYYDERWRDCIDAVRWIKDSMKPQFAPGSADMAWSYDMLAVIRLDRLGYCG